MEPKDQGGQETGAAAGSNQRFPIRMLKGRLGNTEVRNGMCYIMYRSEMDPRWLKPQFIDDTVTDRNRIESLNMQNLNPDISVRTHVKCICTRLLNLREDWYAQTHDGTILCNSCTRCFRCRTLCFTAGRKLNSIDGFVLCNTCMLSYGCYREPRCKIRVQRLPRSLGDMEAEMASKAVDEPENAENADNADNAEAQNNACKLNSTRCSSRRSCIYNSNANNDGDAAGGTNVNEVLQQPRFRNEGRRPLRKILYPDPRPANYGRPDYRFEAPPYLAVDRNAGSQACPECNQQALTQALVVPGCARVYHERSFRCANCKRPMYMGYQTPMVQYQACSCTQQPAKVWCTGHACQLARMAHHTEKNCCLEPVHPGGRPKRDVPGLLPRFDPATINNGKLQDGRQATRSNK